MSGSSGGVGPVATLSDRAGLARCCQWSSNDRPSRDAGDSGHLPRGRGLEVVQIVRRPGPSPHRRAPGRA